jgi:voltage-gated potassium channel
MKRYIGGGNILTPEQRLTLTLSGLALVLAGGVIGYSVVEGWTFSEALYMTIITVATVGFSEVRPLSPLGRHFTIGLIALGVGFVSYSIITIFQMVVEGGLRDIMGRRRVEKELKKLKDHYIVCGHGRMGSIVVDELLKRNLPLIVIETDTAAIEEMLERGILAIHGNAGDEAVLREAGIERARGLVASASSDADNLFITITARGLSKDLLITARAENVGTEQKMMQVGASKVVSPYQIGAYRLVNTLLKPALTQFIELSSLEREMDVRIEEVRVGPSSMLNGKELKETPIRSEIGIIVLAIEKEDRQMVFNPPPDHLIKMGDKLITIGTPEQTDRLVKMAS